MQDDIIDVAKTMVGLEERLFVDLAFGVGGIEGMTPDAIKSYRSASIADWRLTQLKLTPVFGNFEGDSASGCSQVKAHPLPWLVEILNGVEHANFFEQRATEYSQGRDHGFVGRRAAASWANFDKRSRRGG